MLRCHFSDRVMNMRRTVSLVTVLISLVAGTFLCYAEAPVPCTQSRFKCQNGRCIRRYGFCDGIRNCGDNSDEEYCDIEPSVLCPLGWIRCPNMRRCIPPHWICDGVIDCSDISEERNCDSLTCTPFIFKCTNGRCIPRPWFCDGKVDCEDYSDEHYCDISSRSLCPVGWIRCPDINRCILSQWGCDGVTDCTGISEEINCGNNTSKAADVPAAETQATSALMLDTAAAKQELKSWILRRRKPGSGTDQWGSRVHRIAVALHLADNSTFVPENITGEEIRYELTIQLLQSLSKDKISSQELALFIHALLVTCLDPRDFYGDDLVRELRRRVEKSSNYTNPFLILVLCNTGDSMTLKDLERVIAAYNSQPRPFWTDSRALASMALSCISARSGLSFDNDTLTDMLQELKRRQFRNGTVDNFRTTALVTQALFIHDSYKKEFSLDSALKVLIDGLKRSKSLLDAYYAVPVLNGKSLLNITSSHCSKQPVVEEEALQKVLDVTGEAITVQYSVWMGEKINLVRTWRLKMHVNSSIYDAIETVAKIDNRQKVEYNVVNSKPYVTALNGKEDDPEMGIFWFVYLKTLNSDEDPEIVEESPVDIKLKSNQEIILWYKRGPWNDQSLTGKPGTSS